MASTAAEAPSTRPRPLQIVPGDRLRKVKAAIELWLEAERDQLFLWVPVMFGAGIAAWFLLPDSSWWWTALLSLAGVALFAVAIGRGGRAGRVVAVGALLGAAGLALIWWRAASSDGQVLARPVIVTFEARVERVEPLPSRDLVRL